MLLLRESLNSLTKILKRPVICILDHFM